MSSYLSCLEKKLIILLDLLNFWKVDHVRVNKNDKLLGTFSTKDDIIEKLGGELMNPRLSLSEYFNENSFKDKESKFAIHIIVELLIPATAPPEHSQTIPADCLVQLVVLLEKDVFLTPVPRISIVFTGEGLPLFPNLTPQQLHETFVKNLPINIGNQ
ncbi:hypothetical protein C1646_753054 [Rhizophagus diaphanus]|nr:hypothetical protein C1646_753054 [Rhizophagus diaphanus] [Rhizophagus sp. MUCL 43196]